MIQHLCKTCGGELIDVGGGKWTCRYCGNEFRDETVQRDTETLRSLLDDFKIEMVANLRKNLYEELNAPNISSTNICHICEKIKEYLPDDFMANFYYVANGSNTHKLAAAIRAIDVERERDVIDGIVDFLLKSLTHDIVLELMNLVERAYKDTDLHKYEYYATSISIEAERVSRGIYETSIPRSVFIAYSSKDMQKVIDLVNILEAGGITCFVAARNLRHGRGAVENYLEALHQAMDSCKSVVFVSSLSSRNMSCDALRVELPYIKQRDIESAPFEFRQNYEAMPAKFKKPRVEYRLEQSRGFNVADTVVNEFFNGFEFAYSPEEVAQRIAKALVASTAVTEEEKQPSVKFCSKCGTETPAIASICSKCGNRDFLNTYKEYELMLQVRVAKAEQAAAENERQQNEKYITAMNHFESNDVNLVKMAVNEFASLGNFKNSPQMVSECQQKVYRLSTPAYPTAGYQNGYPNQQYPYQAQPPYNGAPVYQNPYYPQPKIDNFPQCKQEARNAFKTRARWTNILTLIAAIAIYLISVPLDKIFSSDLSGEVAMIAFILFAPYFLRLSIRWAYNCRSHFWSGFHRVCSYISNSFWFALLAIAFIGLLVSDNNVELSGILTAGALSVSCFVNIFITKKVGSIMNKVVK